MSDQIQTGRRQALKFLSAAPLLPLGAASILSACGGGGSDFTTGGFARATFKGFPALTLANAAAMATTYTAASMDVVFSDGNSVTYKLAYQPFFLTGDTLPDTKGGTIVAGGYFDINNKPIIDRSVPGKERQFFSDSPDGTSLLALPNASAAGITGKAVFAVVQFEYETRDQAGTDMYGKLPSPIGIITLDQNQTTGKLTPVRYHNVDTSAVRGLWITCGASLSPWNTHLASEEYEPDAFTVANNSMFKAYSKNLYGDETKANPYHYGHLPEVTVNPDGTGSIKKHYCLGRISHELIQVMPDNRTAIMGDDYTNGGFFMFVADKAADLSAGTLYVAKLGPGLSLDPAAPAAPISWIKLGRATSAEIEALANSVKPTDIMSVSFTDPQDASYTKMFCDGVANWVKLNPGMEKAAAFLETHRYANLKGGSMGFTKMEGTTVNIKDKLAYSALQNIQDSMIVNGKGWMAASNIAIPKTLKAGGVIQHSLDGGQKDTDGNVIDSAWVPTSSKALLMGEDIAADATGNLAHPEKIANPDNLKFSEKLRTLFIGEDSGTHVNNTLWAYNVDTKELSRILSIPAGGESTGLHAVDEINGWTYITSNFQHVGDWSSSLHSKVQATLDPLVRANYKDRFGSAVGYLTGDAMALSLKK